MKNLSVYSEYALFKEEDLIKRPPGYFSGRGVSNIQSMADETYTPDSNSQADEANASASDNSAPDKSGQEIQVRTFTSNEDVIVPDDEEIISVDHDRTMAVTRVVTKRTYDAERTQAEKDARAGDAATPTYPQTAGAVPEPPVDPSTSYSWGTLDVTKVQNLEEVKRAGPTIAEMEAASLPTPEEAEKDGLPPNAAKDETEQASEANREAVAESPSPEATEADKQASEKLS